jgi:cytochrome c553
MAKYETSCGQCQGAGSHDQSARFSALAGKQAKLVSNLGSLSGLMYSVTLTEREILDLAAFLSAVK